MICIGYEAYSLMNMEEKPLLCILFIIDYFIIYYSSYAGQEEGEVQCFQSAVEVEIIYEYHQCIMCFPMMSDLFQSSRAT